MFRARARLCRRGAAERGIGASFLESRRQFDFVALQIGLGLGVELPVTQDMLEVCGHAIQGRIIAEDPYADFQPQTGRIGALYYPPPLAPASSGLVARTWLGAGGEVRADTGLHAGDAVLPYYDSLLVKLIAYGRDRGAALDQLHDALAWSVLTGVRTNMLFLADVLTHPTFRANRHTVRFLLDEGANLGLGVAAGSAEAAGPCDGAAAGAGAAVTAPLDLGQDHPLLLWAAVQACGWRDWHDSAGVAAPVPDWTAVGATASAGAVRTLRADLRRPRQAVASPVSVAVSFQILDSGALAVSLTGTQQGPGDPGEVRTYLVLGSRVAGAPGVAEAAGGIDGALSGLRDPGPEGTQYTTLQYLECTLQEASELLSPLGGGEAGGTLVTQYARAVAGAGAGAGAPALQTALVAHYPACGSSSRRGIGGEDHYVACLRSGSGPHGPPLRTTTGLTLVPAGRLGAAAELRAVGAGASGSVLAPIPGKVVKVLVAPEDSVALHAPLVVLDAIKTEHTIRAPRDGTVSAVHCTTGQQVDVDQVLIELKQEAA